MKKLLVGLMLIGFVGVAKAATVGEFFDAFSGEARLTFLEKVAAVNFINLQDGSIGGGAVTSFFEYGPFSLDAGVRNPWNANSGVDPLIGGSFHIDQFLAVAFPSIARGISTVAPSTAQNFLRKLVFGFAPVHNVAKSKFEPVFYSGLEFRF